MKNKKACLMFTGQIRTFDKCIENIFEKLINCNNEYNFDIYFLLDKISYSDKHKFCNVIEDGPRKYGL